MTNISYFGSGTPTVDQNSATGIGQGLQVGQSVINFLTGQVHLNNNQQTFVGRFLGLSAKNAVKDGIVQAFCFKAKAVCTIQLGDNAPYVYQTLNEWVTFKHVNFSKVTITRLATGQIPDVFDWAFMASDDADYDFQIQQVSRESEQEVLFPQQVLSNAVNLFGLGNGVYVQNCNLRGAKKVIVTGYSPNNVGETGIATPSLEMFDAGSGQWVPVTPSTELFTIATNQLKSEQVGDTIQRPINIDTVLATMFTLNSVNPASLGTYRSQTADFSTGNVPALLNSRIGTVLPSGDNIFRLKIIVTVSTLTCSFSITKVFE